MSDARVADGERRRSSFDWIARNIRWVTLGVAVATIAAAPLAAARSQDDPNFDPSGEIYDTIALADEHFQSASPIENTIFIVEARDGGDALSRDVLLEFLRNSEALRASDLTADLGETFRSDLDAQVNGVYSIADEVDAALPGGLEGATDREVKVALADVLGEGAVGGPLRSTLSQRATSRADTSGETDLVIWTAPAFSAAVAIDLTDLGGRTEDGFIEPDAERFLRDVQTELQGDQDTYRALGVAIDGTLTSEEQLGASSPFILLAVVGIMVLVGALLRSYWAAALVAVGLAVTMLIYAAILTLLGFEGGLLVGFIAPISVISFGVDFFVHASGRSREEQVAGRSRDESYVRGLGLVFPALLLAAVSSAVAFMSNAVSGIQAIVQFGIGTAIALMIGFVVLGIVVPCWLLEIEDGLGPVPLERGRMLVYKLGFVVMALVAGVMVTMSVVLPVAGFIGLVVFVPLFVYVPIRWTRRIYRRAAAAGEPTGDVIKGAGHGFRAAGDVVHFLARWRVVTVPITFVLAILGVIGFTQVESEFTFSDFFSEDSDFIASVHMFETHFGETQGGGSGFIYVEGDLTRPDVLAALDDTRDQIDATEAASDDTYLSRDIDGIVVTNDNAVSIVRAAVAAPTASEQAGLTITDADGDGLPDSADEVAAIYEVARTSGISSDDGFMVYPPATVGELLWTDGNGTYATLITVGIPTITEDAVILDARRALDDAAAALASSPAGAALTFVSVSGESITQQDSLAAFTDAMLLALPVALVLCSLLAALFMRSVRYGLTSVLPILLVVGWIYGFMYLFDYKINVVTATIAAIAVGVGIDYSTHFTMRFREEFESEPSRFPALRRAGEGTGGALAISALSSIIGFSVMALAPMPIFVTFGTLTAVMILFSLLVSLLVLPSLLLIVTRRRTGAERQHFLDVIGVAPDEYDPHARETALHGQSS